MTKPLKTEKKRPKRMPVGRRFKPGQCGNPNGRPRSATFAGAMRQLLSEIGPGGKTNAEALAAVCIKKGMKGSPRHIALALDYVEPKPKQGLEISGPNGGPLQLAALSDTELQERASRLIGAAYASGEQYRAQTGAPIAALPAPAEPEESPFAGVKAEARQRS